MTPIKSNVDRKSSTEKRKDSPGNDPVAKRTRSVPPKVQIQINSDEEVISTIATTPSPSQIILDNQITPLLTTPGVKTPIVIKQDEDLETIYTPVSRPTRIPIANPVVRNTGTILNENDTSAVSRETPAFRQPNQPVRTTEKRNSGNFLLYFGILFIIVLLGFISYQFMNRSHQTFHFEQIHNITEFEEKLTHFEEKLVKKFSDKNDMERLQTIIAGLEKNLATLTDIQLKSSQQTQGLEAEIHLMNRDEQIKQLEIHVASLKDLISKSAVAMSKVDKIDPNNEIHIQNILKQYLDDMVDKKLEIFARDRINMTDYALASMGTVVIDSSPTFSPFSWMESLSALKSAFSLSKTHTPSIILDANVLPGNCWCFEGEKGFVTIKLGHGQIQPSAFSLDHISTNSRPKQVELYGIKEKENLLGEFEMDSSRSLQTFHLVNITEKYDQYKLQVLNNYGSQNYTCLYRLRVHSTN
jgi:SUN domain-containing protein 1/2